MIIEATPLHDLYVINYNSFKDKRGEFVKTIHKDEFENAGLNWKLTESFYSRSYKNVIRGMHFQYPPNDHEKLVYVITGSIIDIVLDLRHSSKNFGQFFSIELSAEKKNAVYIGKGFAHGFLSTANESIVEYHTTTVQNKSSEGGVKWDSFGYDWEIHEPIISDRDLAFDEFNKNMIYFK